MDSPGIAIIKAFEQCELEAYLDQGGIPTIGWGHTGPEVHLGLTWTQEHADAVLVQDVAMARYAVRNPLNPKVFHDLTDNQREALTSFVFNIGAGKFASSTLVKLANQGNIAAIPGQMLRWTHVNGVVSAGLERRRKAEVELFERASS